MFWGSSNHTIDPKGRIIVPSRFRDGIRRDGGDRVMITRMDGCLLVFPMARWEQIHRKITSLAETSDFMRRFRRFFIGSACEGVPDKQDRILIPPTLREYAGLERDIVMVGVGEHFEIWSRAKYGIEEDLYEDDVKIQENRNEVARLGI